jgi:hypothetical protein
MRELVCALLFSVCIFYTNAKEVILSSGIGGFSSDQLQTQFNLFKQYSDMKVISTVSILLYGIDEFGKMFSYETNSSAKWTSRKFQKDCRDVLGLGTLPLFFCDSTIGNCSPLKDRLEKVYDHQEEFIKSTLEEIKQWGWDGYSLDFELEEYPSDDDKRKITEFVVQWASALKTVGKRLAIWTSGPTWYDLAFMNNSFDRLDNILTMTMSTYYARSAPGFQSIAKDYNGWIKADRAGYGLLTSPQLKKIPDPNSSLPNPNRIVDLTKPLSREDMIDIGKWCNKTNVPALSIWASVIPDNWIEGIKSYMLDSEIH